MTTDFLQESALIQDVKIATFTAYADDRGRFMETFRREWFPNTDWSKIQHNRSDSKAGVLRGLHYHFHQIDYWVVPTGRVRAALVDLRRSSPTYLKTQTLEMGDNNQVGLYIPEGVAHGFYAITDCTVTYVVNNYYDGGKDEYGVAWDDPQINLDWGLASQPILSDRDRQNPPLAQLNPDVQPG